MWAIKPGYFESFTIKHLDCMSKVGFNCQNILLGIDYCRACQLTRICWACQLLLIWLCRVSTDSNLSVVPTVSLTLPRVNVRQLTRICHAFSGSNLSFVNLWFEFVICWFEFVIRQLLKIDRHSLVLQSACCPRKQRPSERKQRSSERKQRSSERFLKVRLFIK